MIETERPLAPLYEGEEQFKELANRLNALANESRLRALHAMSLNPEGIPVEALAEHLGISQPTLSHHLRILCVAGMARAKKVGLYRLHYLCEDAVSQVFADTAHLLSIDGAEDGTVACDSGSFQQQ